MTTSPPDVRSRLATARDLFAWCHHDATVKAVIARWESGGFQSAEKALIHLCCVLALEKSKLEQILFGLTQSEVK